jgi:hypothetical protein
MGVKEKGTDAVIKGAENALGTTILLRGVGTGETKYGAVRREEVANGGVIELFTIIYLESMYRTTKLGGHVCVKGGKGGGDVGLFADRKYQT